MAFMDNAQVLNNGDMLNRRISELPLGELNATVKETVRDLVENGSLNDRYQIIEDYSIQWHQPKQEESYFAGISLELLYKEKIIKALFINDFAIAFEDMFYREVDFYQWVSEKFTSEIYRMVYLLSIPKTIPLSDFCKQLTQCVYWEITPQNIRILDTSLELSLPDYTRVEFCWCFDHYEWALPYGIDSFSYNDFSFYADGLDSILEYLTENNIDFDEIDTSAND